jgi:hypothetical protein
MSHASDAEKLLTMVAELRADDMRAPLWIAEAQVHSDIALVEEQRLANQIAYLAICEQRGATDADYLALDIAVRIRLRLVGGTQ